MSDISVGTARGVVRIEYESRGAARVSQEFEKIRSQTESTATSFATWANKIGMGSAELSRVNQIQRAVAEAQKTANYFALQQDNLTRSGTASMMERLRAIKLSNTAQQSLIDITKIANEANRRLPMEMARAGSLSAKAFSEEFERGAVAGMQTSSKSGGGLGSAMGSILAMGLKSTVAVAASAAVAGLAGIGSMLAGGFGRLQGIDTATYKLKALKLEAGEVQAVMKDTLKAVEGTQYSLDQAVNVAAGAVQAGIKPGEGLVAYLKDIQGLAAVTGMELDYVGRMMNRVQTMGVKGEDLSQLEYVGVNIMPMLAKEYGKSEAALRKMRENGEIDAAHFNAAIRNNFGEAADIMGNSITGSIANMRTAFKRLGANILAPLFTPIGDKPAAIVSVIKGIQNTLSDLANWFKEHQKGLIDFWSLLGVAVIGAGFVIVNGVGVILGMVGTLSKGVSALTRAIAWVFDTFSGDGIAANLRELADVMSEFGNDTYGATGKLFGLNGALVDGWGNLVQLNKEAKHAVDNANDLVDASEDGAPKLITLTDALGKLGITSEDARKAIEGSDEEWEKFLKTLSEKSNIPKALLDVLKNLRYSFENGGRAAQSYAKALEGLDDSSTDAATKANNLIKALQDINRLPGEGEDALANFNEAIDEATQYNSNLVDILSITGNALVGLDGKIDTNSKNGRTLKKTIEGIRYRASELAATGDYLSADIWQYTRDSLMAVAKEFGITGEAAERLIDTYLLPKHDFELQFMAVGKDDVQRDLIQLGQNIEQAKKDGKNKFNLAVTADDPEVLKKIIEEMGLKWNQYDELTKTAIIEVPSETDIDKTKLLIDKLVNATPTELDSEIKVITTKDEIINQINDGNPLKIPAILDFEIGELPKVEVPGPEAPIFGPPLPLPDPNGDLLPQIAPVPGKENQVTSPDIPDIAPKDHGGGLTTVFPPQPLPPDVIAPTDTGGLFRFSREREKVSNMFSAKEILGNDARLTEGARQQGINFGQSFAQGIRDSIPVVLQAALELATASTDPLGHSPAKIGPLAGSGWTYFRGRTYSEAYAEGIASGQQAVGGAALSIASASSDPLTDSFGRLMKDANEWVSFGKHVFDLVNSLTDIAFNVMNLGQQISGGRLFPKTYERDPNAKKRGPGMPPWYPKEVEKPEVSEYVPNANQSSAVKPGSLSKNPEKQDIADYIIKKAMSQGYSRKQANDFLIQAFGESGLDPNANGGNQDGTGDVRGIFQFTPGTWGNRPGSMINAQDNIDAYFDLAAERGLTPETFTSGVQLGTQVSIGGPWHPQNQAKGHLDRARAGAQQYIDGYREEVQKGLQNFAPQANSNFKSVPFGMAAGTNINYGKSGFPSWVYDLAKSFGIEASTYPNHQLRNGKNTGIDWRGKPEDLEAFSKYLLSLDNPAINQGIYQNPNTGLRIGILKGKPVGPDLAGSVDPGYYMRGKNDYIEHTDHFHTAFDTSIPVPGQGYTRLSSKFGREPVPVTLGPNSIDAQADSGAIPDPLGGPLTGLDALAENDELLRQALDASRGVGSGILSDEQASNALQHLDSVISQQQGLNTDLGRANATALGQVREGIMSSYGMKEAANPLDTAQTITQNVAGIAGDIFNIVDSSLKSVESTKEIGDTLVRGIANTEDVYKIVENVQSFIELGKNIAQTTSDVLGFASTLTGMGAAGDPSGGTAGAAAALGAASGIASIVSQVYSAVNATIDIGQEIYRLGTKYLGRALQNWFGLPGASDIKYLLDTMNGQLQVYASENPQMKSTFNTFERSMGNVGPGRSAPTNNLYIYQGPGQDPRDTMNDAMFAVRSSGIGAFGYAT